ncbi:MAG TPA: dipeptidase [Steroidobacteraceae bacterium]|jgi:membrane dipeptidase|nr:dipeptidase [Steroidobacteraceae bacterium]
MPVRNPSSLSASLLLALGLGLCAGPGMGQAVDARSRALHESLLTLDSHLDSPMLFGVPGWDILDRHSVANDGSQLDYPRMVDGGLDGGFFATYIPQGPLTDLGRANARDAALLRLQEIHQMVAAHPERFELAYAATDAARIAASGRRFVYLSMENGYPLGLDLSLLSTFYKLGVRITGPVHFDNNDLADSSTDPKGARWKGLSPLGKEYVREANRLGMLLDASHASDDVFDQFLELSRTPILLSHSGVRAVFDHPRNLDDARLRRLAASGGVIQISAYSDYMMPKASNPQRDAALAELRRAGAAGATPAQREAQRRKFAEINRQYPSPRATFDDFMRHLLHAIAVAGIDHVGIGLDFDGGGGVNGLEDVSDYPKITAALLKAGYSKDDIAKVWSGNVLRILAQAQAAAG